MICGLAEPADREMRAELSATEGRPILWAARLSPHGHYVLTYTGASPAPEPHQGPADDETLGALLRVPPAEGLAERVRTACFDRAGNRWPLCLNSEHIESVAYAFHLRSMAGSVTEANRFAREYARRLPPGPFDEQSAVDPAALTPDTPGPVRRIGARSPCCASVPLPRRTRGRESSESPM
ncbi:DUF6417 family protein [Streptomyces sp. NPDC004059]